MGSVRISQFKTFVLAVSLGAMAIVTVPAVVFAQSLKNQSNENQVTSTDPNARMSQKPTFGSFDSNSPDVVLGGYILSNSERHKYLQTTGVATCVAVSLYDPATKTGVVAHFAAGTDSRNEMLMLIKAMKDRGIPVTRIDAKMVGGWAGWKESERTVAELRKALKDAGVRVSFSDVNSKKAPPTVKQIMAGVRYTPPEDPFEVIKNMQLNLKTGEFRYVRTLGDKMAVGAAATSALSSRSVASSSASGSGPRALVPHSASLEIFGTAASGEGSPDSSPNKTSNPSKNAVARH